MTAIDGLGAQAMVDDGPFGRFSRVVDIGGGRGHITHVILDTLPELRGVVMDRAPVIELAKKAGLGAGGGPARGGGPRCRCPGGRRYVQSGYDSEGGRKAPASMMRYIRDDWPIKDAPAILKTCVTAMARPKTAVPSSASVPIPTAHTAFPRLPVMHGSTSVDGHLRRGAERNTDSGKALSVLSRARSVGIHPFFFARGAALVGGRG